MCICTDMKTALKADEPIYCYKLIDCYPSCGDTFRFVSPLMDYEYIPDTVMLAKCGGNGFLAERPAGVPEGTWFEITYGFHSYVSMDAMHFDTDSCARSGIILAKCRIPRGARYWKGTQGGTGLRKYDQYCSDRIEFVAWSMPERIEWLRPKVQESHMTKIQLVHPELYSVSPRKPETSILRGLRIEEAAGRISAYELKRSRLLGNARVYQFRSPEYGCIELRTMQGKVYGVNTF